MEYQKFVMLIDKGEQRNVDFKIKCDAFNQKQIGANAELAKDICAMANNGNTVSYLIIGVSNDRKNFHSVDNEKLTDDALQDFCKKGIFPPPKIKLERNKWVRTAIEHKDKEFIIIHIGPNRKQAFRLAVDFIDYLEKVCYRRNEVWIRRGATSDIATPEEIARLLNGESIEVTREDEERIQERHAFSLLSIIEKRKSIDHATQDIFNEFDYMVLQNLDPSKTSNADTIPFWKQVSPSLISINWLPCQFKLGKRRLDYLPGFHLRLRFLRYREIPEIFVNVESRRRIRSVRRILFIPVLSTVTNTQIQTSLPNGVSSGIRGHFYFTNIKFLDGDKIREFIPCSTELLIIDKLESLSDFYEKGKGIIKAVEDYPGTIIPLPKTR